MTPVAALTQTESSAVASLVLGILGFVACPVVCSILAIVFGNQAKNRIRANPALEGENLAKAGIILGWVGVGLSILGVVFFLLFTPMSLGLWVRRRFLGGADPLVRAPRAGGTYWRLREAPRAPKHFERTF